MEYKYLLDYIYSNYKTYKYEKNNENIKFTKECNTSIVKFTLNKDCFSNVKGTIVEQAHYIIIYFNVRYNGDNYLFLSRTKIIHDEINKAIVHNCLTKNGLMEFHETLIRTFENRIDLFKFSSDDIKVKDNLIESGTEALYNDIINDNSQKKITKRL